MSVLDFESNGTGDFWNYHDPNKDGFALEITGDVVAISTPQATNYATKQPEFWPSGEPKLLICLHIALPDGTEVKWSFGPGSRKTGGSRAVQAIRAALGAVNAPAKSVTEIGNKNITISTQQGSYNSNNPRPWAVRINGPATAPYRGVDESQPERMKPQPVPQAAYQAVQNNMPPQQNLGPQQARQAMQAAVQQQQAQQYQQQQYQQPVPYSDQDIPF